MGQPVPAQHPSVVLRSHFNLVRTLLIIAMAAVCALAAVVVILANDDNESSTAGKAPGRAATDPEPGAGRHHSLRRRPRRGHPRSGIAARSSAAGTRFDGGPDEGSRGPAHVQFKERAGGPSVLNEGR